MSSPPALTFSASLRLPLVEAHLRQLEPTSVVEVGCGQGAMAYRLAQRFDYRGYEPDQTSYASAQRYLDRLG
ncbi:MAG: class I SAM-dependent methyltransferase, partial [Acidimicrobiia bacterium]|nr:class I SAM-dependent methyltransferase [Acidimicrobiia bacterium]